MWVDDQQVHSMFQVEFNAPEFDLSFASAAAAGACGGGISLRIALRWHRRCCS